MTRWLLLLAVTLSLTGCGTTRVTDTARTATEQLLISKAIDESVASVDFRPLAGKSVYFDPQYLEGVPDKGYLISSFRQHLLASGALLQEERSKATYVVEARAGAVGTDRHSVLIGVPQFQLPMLYPNMPTQIPEIPLAKSTDQKGVAKIAVFAYNRQSGRPIMQSGLRQASSSARDRWILGLGPFQSGSIRNQAEFAGAPLPFLSQTREEAAETPELAPMQAAWWLEAPSASPAGNLAPSAPGAIAPAGPPLPPSSPLPGAAPPQSAPPAASNVAPSASAPTGPPAAPNGPPQLPLTLPPRPPQHHPDD